MTTNIIDASGADSIQTARSLFLEYERAIGVDLSFQGFAEELATLPGAYARPRGRLFLALEDERPLGCAALRPLDSETAEMKRLYVRANTRGRGLGRLLASMVIAAAREIGYRRIRLDTLPTMPEAIAMYRSLGFTEIPAYTTNPIAGSLYFELVF